MISVTQVIDYLTEPELLNWYITKGKAACKKIGDESLRIGKIVDGLVQQDIKGQGYLIPNGEAAISSCMTAWEKFKKAEPTIIQNIESIQQEITDGEIVGHPDILTKYFVIDVKTSRAIQPRHWTQTAKYAQMARKPKIAILRLDKELGIYEWKEQGQEVIDYEMTVFNAYLVAYKHNTIIREIIRKQLEMEVLGVE